MANTASAHVSACVPLTHGRLNGADQICVHARLLHQYVQNPIQFLEWFRIKSQALGLVCHRDYEPSLDVLEGLSKRQNFLLTLEAATVLAAGEGSDRGQELCRYLLSTSEQQNRLPIAPLDAPRPLTITTSQAEILKQLANERVSDTGLPYQTVWSELKNQFGIKSYLHLQAEEFESACDFLSRPPQFLPPIPFNFPGDEQEIVLPGVAREVIESYSFDLSIDSLPLVRLILRNYIFQHADPAESLNDSRYVHRLLSQRFRHIEDCLRWANRRGW